jgi:recombination protein RecA
VNPDITTDNRTDVLAATIAKLEKQFGVGTIMRLGDEAIQKIDAIPTGALSLDLATGIGGYPRGRVSEIFGPESSGKTTLTLHAIASCQRLGGIAAFVDAEHALDPTYARALGVDLDALLVSQPDNGEQALSVVEHLVGSGVVDLVVVDSVAALVPRAELEGEMGDMIVGLQARLMSQALRKLTGVAHRNRAAVIFINQLRQKIGVTFGSGETTTGGNALKFYASIRLDVRRIGAVKEGTESVGNRTRVRVVKNKLAPPFRQVEFDIRYGQGICAATDLLDLAEHHAVIQRSGSWYSLDEERIGNGRERAREYLEQHPDTRADLESRLVALATSSGEAPASDDA